MPEPETKIPWLWGYAGPLLLEHLSFESGCLSCATLESSEKLQTVFGFSTGGFLEMEEVDI